MQGSSRGGRLWLGFLLFGCIFVNVVNYVETRDAYWAAPVSGLWSRPENWRGGVVPNKGDVVHIIEPGQYIVTLDEPVSIDRLILGSPLHDVQNHRHPIFDITFPLYAHQINVSKNAVLQLEHEFHGGEINVDGQLYMCGSCTMNASNVEIMEDAIFEVWYDLPFGTGDEAKRIERLPTGVVYDFILGEELSADEVSITVPSKVGDVTLPKEEQRRYIAHIARELASIGGGSTALFGKGFWVSPQSGALIEEEIAVVSTYCKINDAVKLKIRQLARWLATSLSQECVLVKLNRQTFLISQ